MEIAGVFVFDEGRFHLNEALEGNPLTQQATSEGFDKLAPMAVVPKLPVKKPPIITHVIAPEGPVLQLILGVDPGAASALGWADDPELTSAVRSAIGDVGSGAREFNISNASSIEDTVAFAMSIGSATEMDVVIVVDTDR